MKNDYQNCLYFINVYIFVKRLKEEKWSKICKSFLKQNFPQKFHNKILIFVTKFCKIRPDVH